MTDTALELARARAAARQRASSVAQQPQGEVIATTPDGGRFVRINGAVSFASPGYSTSDPAKVAELMEGASPVELVQTDIDQQRIAGNPVAARANEFVRGTPFVGSYADEAVGVFSPQARDNMRATTGAMQRQNPGQTAALNMAGTVVGALPLAAAAAPTITRNAGATIGTRALQGSLAGSATGSVEGTIYGSGEGENRAERIDEAKFNALVGLGGGAVLGALAPYGAEGIKYLATRYRGTDIAKIASELGVSRAAASQLRNAFDVGDIAQAEAALNRAGDDAMLADAGDAAAVMLDGVATAGGQGVQIVGDAVSERVGGASGALVKVLDDTLGRPRGPQELIDEIRLGTQGQRSAAYDAAYSKPIDYASSRGRRLESLMGRVPASAVRKANELMRIDGDTSAQIMASFDGDTVTFTQLPDVRQLDYIARALGDVADQADGQGKLGGTTQLGRSTQNLQRAIRQTLRRAVPEYGEALDTAADAISRRNAVDLGYDLFAAGTKREDVARAVSGAGADEKAAMREGLRSYVDEVTSRVTRTITDNETEAREGIKILRDFSSRGNREKLRMILGRDATALIDEVDRAATAFELRAAIATNTKTAQRTAFREGVQGQASDGIVRTLASGEPVNATKRFIQAMTGEGPEARQIRELGLYEEIATVLTQTRGQNANRALRLINRAIEGQEVSEAQARFVATTLMGSAVLTGNRGASLALQ